MQHLPSLLLAIWVSAVFSLSSQAAVVTAHFTSAETVPVTAASYTASGNSIELSLGYAPTTGTNLTVVRNTGLPFINGTFGNLAHGQEVNLSFGGTTYQFVANYYGGTGNDLVLQWARISSFSWGYNHYGQLGNNSPTTQYDPSVVAVSEALAGKTIVSIAAGQFYSLALCSDGTLVAWGRNDHGQLGNNSTAQQITPVVVTATGVLAGKTVVSIAVGDSHSLALCSDGTLVAWGSNEYGQLGDNSTTDRITPVALTATGALAGKTVVSIAAGDTHSFALCSDGTLVAWGRNDHGQLGNNSTAQQITPVAVTATGVLAGKTVVSIAAGEFHSLALCSDGTLVAWGHNGSGQLRITPVDITATGVLAGKTVVSIAAGDSHSLALCSDGTLVAWGSNEYGQLGDNSTTGRITPVSVTATGVLAGKTVVSITAGWQHSLALCSDGTLVAWGQNVFGQLGTTNAAPRQTTPLALSASGVLAGKSAVSIAAGDYHSLTLAAAPALLPQSIDFLPIADRQLKNDTSISLAATASSGLPVSYSVVSGPSTISGSTLSLNGPGIVTVRASQAGNFAYTAATPVERSFTVSKSSQTITFAALADRFLKDGTNLNLGATSDAELPISYTLLSGPASLSGSKLSLNGPGIVTVRASQAGDFAYTAATPVERSFTVSKSSQTINFAALADRFVKDGTNINLGATSDSGLAISYTLVSGPATLSGSTLTLTGPGTVTVRASQTGNFAYTTATPVERSFTVSQSSQEITFPALADRFLKDGTTVNLGASTPSGLAIAFTLVSGPATLSGSTLTLTGPGTVTVRASQAGNFAYLPATPVDRSFTVSKSVQSITFPALAGRLFRAGLTIPLGATSSSGLPVSYSVVSGPASVTGSNLVIQQAGTVVVRASQAGNFAHHAATPEDRSVVIAANSAPTNLVLSRNWFYDNVSHGTEIGILSATDVDIPSGDGIVYQLVPGTGATDNSKFTLSGSSLRTNATFDYAGQKTASIRIRATDNASQWVEQVFVLQLLDGTPFGMFVGKSITAQMPAYVNLIFQLVDNAGNGIDLPRELFESAESNPFLIEEQSGLNGDGSPRFSELSRENFAQTAKLNEVESTIKTVVLIDLSDSTINDAVYAAIQRGVRALIARMAPNQQIALYGFGGEASEQAVRIQDFTSNKVLLEAAVTKLPKIGGGTNLFDAMIATLPLWTDRFEITGINAGSLVIFTDGSDTSSRQLISQALSVRGSKQVYTVALKSADLSNDAISDLRKLQNAGYFQADDPNQLAASFEAAQNRIASYAKSFYWVNYYSVRDSGTHAIRVSLKNNQANNSLTGTFSAEGFSTAPREIIVNRRVDRVEGTTALSVPVNGQGEPFDVLSFRAINRPSEFEFTIADPSMLEITALSPNRFQASGKGRNGATTVIIRDRLNRDSTPPKTVTFTIGSGVVPSPPSITAQPLSATILLGDPVSFKVVATGNPTYQWRLDGKNIPGATQSTYALSKTTALHDGSYTVVVRNPAGSITSSVAKLTFGTAPKITRQPAALTVRVGSSATFSVAATGNPAVTYQWRFKDKDIEGATQSSYTISKTALTNAGGYTVVVRNLLGSVTSSTAALTFGTTPKITRQPVSLTVRVGKPATFRVTASGTPAITYQWRFKGKPIKGATRASYTISKALGANAGSYSVVVRNAFGSTSSKVAKLTVIPATSGAKPGPVATLAPVAEIRGFVPVAAVPKLTIASPLAPPFLIPGEVITCTGMVIDALNNELHHGTLRISPLSASRIDGGNYTYTRTSASTAVLNYETSVGQMGDFSEEENGSIQLTFTSPTGGTFTSSACYVGMDRDGLFGGCLLKSGTFTITRK